MLADVVLDFLSCRSLRHLALLQGQHPDMTLRRTWVTGMMLAHVYTTCTKQRQSLPKHCFVDPCTGDVYKTVCTPFRQAGGGIDLRDKVQVWRFLWYANRCIECK